MKTQLVFSAFLLLVMVSPAISQEETATTGFFSPRTFSHYFPADHYAPLINLGTGISKGLPDYDITGQDRGWVVYAGPVLGTELPLFYRSWAKSRFAVSMPVSFSVWWDFLEERTAPILNTDYRVAPLEFNFSRQASSKWIRNFGIRFIPAFHESTHLGDELTLCRVRDSIPIHRINISYETAELSFQVNDPYGAIVRNLTARAGVRVLWKPGKGFYSVDTLEVPPSLQIKPSERWAEPWIQFQYQDPVCRLSNKRMMFVLSSDFSLRVRYGYPIYIANPGGMPGKTPVSEAYRLSGTVMAGWNFLTVQGENSGLGAFIKLYNGINPHGQFRNHADYTWIGLAVTYAP
ncbi:MAG: DUF1207 domain-containing protein [Bacteroidales bacterium]